MAAATVLVDTVVPIIMTNNNNPKQFLKVCFSFAAYAKNLIDYLKYCNVPIESGLTDAEFSSIESNFNFTFPPDLRSILQEGLPAGPGFPNWRLFSVQQLQILTRLPIMGLCKDVARRKFWIESAWGERPAVDDEAVSLANEFLMKSAPLLVPIYRNFYIPSSPCLAGNPVFYVDGCDVKLFSFDICGFFQQVDFRKSITTNYNNNNYYYINKHKNNNNSFSSLATATNHLFKSPAWAAREPRRIEFWTELVERGERVAATVGGVHWWWWWSGELGNCLEQVFWKLRNGGWKEEEVREMMLMMMTMDGPDVRNQNNQDSDLDDNKNRVVDKELVMWQLRMLARKLLNAGWSTEDVVDAFGFSSSSDHRDDEDYANSLFDFNRPTNKT